MLDLRQFQALCAIAELGSSAAAARSLGWSQPTITHHIDALARATGAAVVTSSAAGTTLTEAGELWLPHARAIVHRARQALTEVTAALETGRRTVRLGVFPTAAPRLLPAVVSTFAGAGLTAAIVEAELPELVQRLDGLQLDAAIVYTSPDEPAGPAPAPGSLPDSVHLFAETFSVILPAGHPRADAASLDLRELGRQTWVVGLDDDDPVEQAFRQAAGARGFSPIIGPRTDDYRVVIEYVAAGLGVAIVPELALPIGRMDIVARQVDGLRLTRHVLLATTPTLDAGTRAVILEALADALAGPIEH